MVKNNNKWGLIDWFFGYLIVPYSYKTPVEVPLISVDLWEINSIENARKKLNADLVLFDDINGDGVFRARNKYTKKWGMYQSLGETILDELIPMDYDKIEFFQWNAPFTAVYQNEKVGFYLSKWSYDESAKQSVICLYDDYKNLTINNSTYLAVQKADKWAWVDWFTGEEKSAFIYNTTEELPYPNWE